MAVLTQDHARELSTLLPADYTPTILVGQDGYVTMATLDEAVMVLSSQVGAAGLRSTMAAAEAGKIIALANKESLVLAGALFRTTCARTGAVILPVDSEHNAIFQALCGHEEKDVRRIILTASGGPFRGKTRDFLQQVSCKQALAHPNWTMGPKISIDSSTLMNKGLEVIEACHLYGVGTDMIDVVVHAQSVVHSLVEYVDGSQLAHMGPTDMQIPIAHCLGWPRRVDLGLEPLNLAKAGTLTFEEPDLHSFPCLALAMKAFEAGAAYPVAMNAANEIAVAAFLQERIPYLGIADLIEQALAAVTPADSVADLESILALDQRIRRVAQEAITS